MSDTRHLGSEMQRLPGWDIRLYKFLNKTRREGYTLDWNHFNCALWSADAVMHITGVDIYAEYRGKVDSPLSAYKAIRSHGFNSIVEVMDAKLDRIARGLSTYGDLVLVPAPEVMGHNLEVSLASPGNGAVIGSPDAQASSSWQELGISHALCIVEPPFFWSLNELGLMQLPMTDDCIVYGVGH